MNDNKDINGSEAYYKKIGKIIKHNLKAAGISEEQAAEVVGLSPYLFKKILNGYMGINVKEIKDICKKLNIDYSVALNDGDLEKIFMDKDPLEVVTELIYEYMKLEWRISNGEKEK
jgi:transcriptional regulator with XRE-family HTH domain